MTMTCPYCTDPEVKERVIIQNDLVFAFPTNIPIVPGHTLICPIRCVPTFEDLTPEEARAMFELRGKVRVALIELFGAEGFHYVWNKGSVAGQSVPHFHLHVIPRKSGDEGVTEYEPRKFLYRLGSREKTPTAELVAVAELIRKNL